VRSACHVVFETALILDGHVDAIIYIISQIQMLHSAVSSMSVTGLNVKFLCFGASFPLVNFLFHVAA
jgi:hypothetical protein